MVTPSSEYEIDPHTERWSPAAKLGYGLVAAIPLALLAFAGLAGLVDAIQTGSRSLDELAAMLLYAHFVSQFIVLAIYGHLLVEHDHLSTAAKLWWGVCFLSLAPAAVIAFWVMHVIGEGHAHGRTRVRDVTPHPNAVRDPLAELGPRHRSV